MNDLNMDFEFKSFAFTYFLLSRWHVLIPWAEALLSLAIAASDHVYTSADEWLHDFQSRFNTLV